MAVRFSRLLGRFMMLGGAVVLLVSSPIDFAKAAEGACVYSQGNGSDRIKDCRKNAQGFEDWRENAPSESTSVVASYPDGHGFNGVSSTYWRGRIWMATHDTGDTIAIESMEPGETSAVKELVFLGGQFSKFLPGSTINSEIAPAIAGTEGRNAALHLVFGVHRPNGGTEFFHVTRAPVDGRPSTRPGNSGQNGNEGAWRRSSLTSVAGHYGSTHPSLHASGRSLYMASIYQSGKSGSYADSLYIYHHNGQKWVKGYRAMSMGKPIRTDPKSPAALIVGTGSSLTVVLKEKKSKRLRKYAMSLRYGNLGNWRDVGPLGFASQYAVGRPTGTIIDGDLHLLSNFGNVNSDVMYHIVASGAKSAMRAPFLTQGGGVRAQDPSLVSYYRDGRPVVQMIYMKKDGSSFDLRSVLTSGDIRFPR